jgi:hypothetical protein
MREPAEPQVAVASSKASDDGLSQEEDAEAEGESNSDHSERSSGELLVKTSCVLLIISFS